MNGFQPGFDRCGASPLDSLYRWLAAANGITPVGLRRGCMSKHPRAHTLWMVGLENMGVGLEEQSNVGVPDSLADDLRTHAGRQRVGRVGVAQIMKVMRGRGRGEEAESLPGRVGMRRSAVLEGEHI